MQNWKSEARRLKFIDGGSWTEVAAIIRARYFQDEEPQKIHEKVRSYLRGTQEYRTVKQGSTPEQSTVVGVISDLHSPFIKDSYFDFVKDTFKQHKVTDVVFIGDIVDLHSISRHMTEPSARGAHQEYVMAYEALRPFVKAFPEAKVCRGNHDNIVERQMATLGMPAVFVKSFKELWGLPDTWEIDSQFIIDNVFYHHGLGAGGVNGAINKALNERMSVVQGHQHTVFNIDYRANQRDIIFGMSVGSGIDNTQYSFEYGKYNSRKPIIGCGIVRSSSDAQLVPMPEHYFRT